MSHVHSAPIIVIDSDDWTCMRAAELRSKGVKFQIVMLIKNQQVDCSIKLEDGTVERPVGARLMPGGWEAYCVPEPK